MKERKKIVFNVVFFISLIALTYYIIFKDYSINDIINNLKNLNRTYLLISILFMSLYLVVEALNIKVILNSFKEKISLFKMVLYSFVCFLFSAITPGGSGGQPVTIYYMSKEKIKVSHSTLGYLIQLFGYNISSFILGIISAILNPQIFESKLLILFIVGSLFLLIPISLTVVGIFSKSLLKKIIDLLVIILELLKLKNIESIKTKIYDELKVFNDSSNYIKTHKLEFSKSLVLSFIQITINYSIPYFIFKSFGLSGYSIVFFIQLQAILHNAAISIPLPGAVGITETVFLLVYSNVYPAYLLHSSLIVNRIVTFYLYVVLSLFIFVLFITLKKKQSK